MDSPPAPQPLSDPDPAKPPSPSPATTLRERNLNAPTISSKRRARFLRARPPPRKPITLSRRATCGTDPDSPGFFPLPDGSPPFLVHRATTFARRRSRASETTRERYLGTEPGTWKVQNTFNEYSQPRDAFCRVHRHDFNGTFASLRKRNFGRRPTSAGDEQWICFGRLTAWEEWASRGRLRRD